ncbi:LysR family transcriptional regulator [Teichococcus vastitatis]|uniref:LysR family transcriptional regulator n=1 Tax=Teichococcus vastitatis TaxID=2307076 RepID=A0ABS9W7W3_9PROT|nr:LysR family transcriptional regulator [Pseudoroseomonas vastitatis]MCI0755327.1 LysR family transcriptional regulator [Pseudoroseomonas vastitatis]
MDRELWSGLAVFAEIVEAGSFAKAATRLGLSASALSHAMRALEGRLGMRLLDRTTRSLSPTGAGEQLLLRLRPAMSSVEEVLAELDVARDRPAGRVRVNAHRPAAVHLVLPRIATLAQRCPEVAVELVVNDGLIDIVAERFDCGVRHEGGLQGDMISVRISEPMELVFAATPAYLEAHGAPATSDDLGAHRCISYRHTSSGALHRWEFVRDGEVFARAVPETFVTNDVDLMRDAALAGLGVVCLLRLQAAPYLACGALAEVLPGWAPVLAANHLYYPSRRQPSAAFRAFLEVMRA